MLNLFIGTFSFIIVIQLSSHFCIYSTLDEFHLVTRFCNCEPGRIHPAEKNAHPYNCSTQNPAQEKRAHNSPSPDSREKRTTYFLNVRNSFSMGNTHNCLLYRYFNDKRFLKGLQHEICEVVFFHET